MKKYRHLLKYELKTLFKDSTNLFLLVYPLIMLAMLGWMIPAIIDKVNNNNTSNIILMIALATVFAVGSFVAGAMLGFSLLENKDEKTILSIAVSPIRVSGYILFKSIYTYILAFLGNFILIGGLKLFFRDDYVYYNGVESIYMLDLLTWGNVISFVLVNSLFVPSVALAFGSLAKNKIEGFAYMKSSGFIIMIPLLTLLEAFRDWKQYILGIFPNFWSIKAILNITMGLEHSANLPYYLYLLIGGLYMIAISFAAYRLFMKKNNV
ncbi:MAG: ABC transporter permease [Bacilli bacterium]|jgi:fluoroquinolone transport system permease protein|nr:ABC transporter permease [Bacilli bacterium]MDY0064507.1 ABC transporter permease [Bacilli bacterium]